MGFVCTQDGARTVWSYVPRIIYSTITNKMQSYTVVFITIIAVQVSGSSSAHHQELKTVYAAPGICQVFLLLTAIVGELDQLTHESGKKQKNFDKFLMMCLQF